MIKATCAPWSSPLRMPSSGTTRRMSTSFASRRPASYRGRYMTIERG